MRKITLSCLCLLLAAGCGSTADPDPDDGATDVEIPDGCIDVDEDSGSGDVAVEDPGPEDVTDEDATLTPPPPLFDAVAVIPDVIEGDDDEADVYHPDPPDLATGGYQFPVALLLQGAEVERQHYSGFAAVVASHGFVVVVPDHETISMAGPGLYAEQSQVPDALDWCHAVAIDPSHPLQAVVDCSRLVLLGHSYGGACGLSSVSGSCEMPWCMTGFTRPAELMAGAFWGTNLALPFVGSFSHTHNDGIPVLLVQGTLDGMAHPVDTVDTWTDIDTPPKTLIEVLGANHYGICDVNNPPGADADSATPTIEQPIAVETIGRWTALFLRAHVLSDAAALDWVHGGGDAHDPWATIANDSV